MWKASLNAGLCGSVGGGVDGVGKRSPIHIFFIPVNVTKKEHFMVNRHDSRVLNILAGIFLASNSFPFLMNSLVVLKYSNDVTVARNHQRNINTLCWFNGNRETEIEMKEKQRQNVHIWIFISIENMYSRSTSKNSTNNSLIHCTKLCEGAIYFACVSRQNTFFTLTMSVQLKARHHCFESIFFIHSNRISFAM